MARTLRLRSASYRNARSEGITPDEIGSIVGHAKAPSFPHNFLAAVFARPKKGLDLWLLSDSECGYCTMADMDIRHGISKVGQAPILQTSQVHHIVSFTPISLREGHRHSGNRKPDAIFNTIRYYLLS